MSDDTPPTVPARDARAAAPVRTLDTPRPFPEIRSAAEWKRRRERIRRQVLVSAGLYPPPPKTPLNAKVFGRVERDGYTIEKAHFETYPGFYLAGNLYRPLRQTNDGRRVIRPGVLVAHGHWNEGRMADAPEGSIAARAITFARQGYVAFTYDMVAYNDTRQFPNHRTWAVDDRSWLWGVSMLGLQTWNSTRALDFLVSLPDVDLKRLAITGESGGGTQTMMMGVSDDRLAAVGPCVMVSHTMQGGCICENAPGLRVQFSNVEIAAAAAPKYQVIVGATGDWTKTTQTMEGPSVASIYKLLGVPDRVRYATHDYGHNINKDSRETVYAAFGDWLLKEPDESKLKEPPYAKEPTPDLRVFPDGGPLPADAKTPQQMTDFLIEQAREAVESRKPKDAAGLRLFKKTFLPMWETVMQVETPTKADLQEHISGMPPNGTYLTFQFTIGRAGRGDSIRGVLFAPVRNQTREAVVLIHPRGRFGFTRDGLVPGPLTYDLLKRGRGVVVFEAFQTGAAYDERADRTRQVPFGQFFTTYNRTDSQERVQDLATVAAWMRTHGNASRVSVAGFGRAGLWALLAAPAFDRVAADCDRLDLTSDDALLTPDLYVPLLRRMGDFRTAATLAAPNPLLLHNTGDKFNAQGWISEVYQAVGAQKRMMTSEMPVSEAELAAWLSEK